jgi:hypothetical protein
MLPLVLLLAVAGAISAEKIPTQLVKVSSNNVVTLTDKTWATEGPDAHPDQVWVVMFSAP